MILCCDIVLLRNGIAYDACQLSTGSLLLGLQVGRESIVNELEQQLATCFDVRGSIAFKEGAQAQLELSIQEE